MRVGKKKESLLGIIITVVLCLGFLWWWFRPAPHEWEEHDAVKLVERAAKEPKPESRVERQILDLDLMEIALSQVREHRREEALAVAKHIEDPVIRTLTARQLAHVYFSSESADLGEVLGFAAIASEVDQAAVRADILGMLATAGFPDAALPEAKTPLQKVILANRILDEKLQDKVSELVAGAQAAVPSLPPAEVVAVRREIAKARVMLTRKAPPAEAIAAIKELPLEERTALWEDLAGICQGRTDARESVPLVFQQVEDPAARRRMEITSMIFGVKLRPAAEIIADCRRDVEAAESPAARVVAMLTLAKAQYDGGDDELKAASLATLQEALRTARTISDPGASSRALLSLARRFNEIVELDLSGQALQAAVGAARTVNAPMERIPLLVEAEDETRKQSDEPGAVKLMDEAVELTAKGTNTPDAATVKLLASALVRRGEWLKGLMLVDRLKVEAERQDVLLAAATTAAEGFNSVDPANPPARGEPFDTIRKDAIADQLKAANETEAQPAGFARARGWLAMAKAVFTPPMNLTEYMAGGAQQGEGGGTPEERGKDGEEPKEDAPLQEK